MSNPIDGHSVPALSTGLRFQWEPAQDSHVLLYPEGMVKLNGSAAAIMELVDGERSAAAIVAELERRYGSSGLLDDVLEFLITARERGWIDVH